MDDEEMSDGMEKKWIYEQDHKVKEQQPPATKPGFDPALQNPKSYKMSEAASRRILFEENPIRDLIHSIQHEVVAQELTLDQAQSIMEVVTEANLVEVAKDFSMSDVTKPTIDNAAKLAQILEQMRKHLMPLTFTLAIVAHI